MRLFNEFLFGLNRWQKISPFLKAIHRVFLLFEATLRRIQLSIPAPVCAQLCEISLFRKFFKLLYVSTDQRFPFCNSQLFPPRISSRKKHHFNHLLPRVSKNFITTDLKIFQRKPQIRRNNFWTILTLYRKEKIFFYPSQYTKIKKEKTKRIQG